MPCNAVAHVLLRLVSWECCCVVVHLTIASLLGLEAVSSAESVNGRGRREKKKRRKDKGKKEREEKKRGTKERKSRGQGRGKRER